jgi:hypothetical protein
LCSRLENFKPVIQSIVEFSKFEYADVGGIRSHILSSHFASPLEQYSEAESKLSPLECYLLKISRREIQIEIEKIQREFENSDATAVSIAI